MAWPKKNKEEPPKAPVKMEANIPDEVGELEPEQPTLQPPRTPKQIKTLMSSPRTFYDSKQPCENCGRECLMKIPIGVPKYTYILKDVPICKLCQCPILTVQVEEPEQPVEQLEPDYE